MPERPWQDLSVNFITYLPTSEGYENLIVVIDRLLKNPILVLIDRIVVKEVAKGLLKNVFCHHGFPKTMVSDRGS